jgi:ribose-phosphate pyrophosphokinase
MTKVLVLEDTFLGKKILGYYNEFEIIPYNFVRFSDGEMCVELQKPVRGDDVIVVSSINEPVNDNLVKVIICADALKRASAKSITLIAPYLGYSRQDRRAKPWQPITARLIADVLQVSGINRITTCDLHASQIEGFYSIPIDNIPVLQILGHRWRKEVSDVAANDLVVVSPDAGGVTRARLFMNEAKIPNLAVINKYREKANVVSSMQVIGDIKDKIAVIIDDMVDTGGTLMRAATELKSLGAKKVYVYCTHGVLSQGAIEKLSNFDDIEKLFITDTIDKMDKLINDKIVYVDISDIIIGIINTFRDGTYISDLIAGLLK